MSTYIAVCKRDFVPLVGDDEECIPGNIGALKKGLQALLREDAEDDVRAEQKWAQGKALLAEEQEDDCGAAAGGKIMVSDDLDICSVGDGL